MENLFYDHFISLALYRHIFIILHFYTFYIDILNEQTFLFLKVCTVKLGNTMCLCYVFCIKSYMIFFDMHQLHVDLQLQSQNIINRK